MWEIVKNMNFEENAILAYNLSTSFFCHMKIFFHCRICHPPNLSGCIDTALSDLIILLPWLGLGIRWDNMRSCWSKIHGLQQSQSRREVDCDNKSQEEEVKTCLGKQKSRGGGGLDRPTCGNESPLSKRQERTMGRPTLEPRKEQKGTIGCFLFLFFFSFVWFHTAELAVCPIGWGRAASPLG